MSDPAARVPGADRRRADRRPTAALNLVYPVVGEVVDLSGLGLGVCTADAMRPGARFHFTFGADGVYARVVGQVAWCRLVGNLDNGCGDRVPTYRGGVRFLGEPP